MPTDKARMPYFQMYAADWLASGKVASMTTEEAGAHFFLMCQAWLADPPASIPDDDEVLSRWTRLADVAWSKCKPRVLAAWELRDGRWFQPRMETEWRKATGAKEAQIRGGREGGLKSAQGRVKPTSSQPSRVPQPFSESEADTDTRQRERGASVRDIHAKATDRQDAADSVWTALEAWAKADPDRRGSKGIDAAHGERSPILMALASWRQEPDYPNGVKWDQAVCRCVRAAMGNGTRFGDSPKYAVKVIGGMLAAWRDGKPPETQASGGSNGSRGKQTADQRRSARAADEFPEQIILPTS